jgi:mannosyltransferase
MWLDEAYSAYAADKGFTFLWHVVPRYETHPPFYYSLLRLWTLGFGEGLVAERALGLTAGLLAAPVIGWSTAAAATWLGWDPRRRRLAVFAAFALACLSIPLVEMSREVRPYPVMILVYALATRALIGIALRRAAGRPLAGLAYAGYLICLELMLWLHNLGPLWGAALGLTCLLAVGAGPTKRTDWGWFAGGHAAVALFYLPALAILVDQAPTWVAHTWLQFSAASLAEHLHVLYAVPGWQGVAAALLLMLALGILVRGHEGRRLLAMLLPLALLPTALSILLSMTVAPVFITRTLTPVAAPWLVLLALGAVGWARPIAWIGAGAALTLGANMLAVDVQQRAGPPIQNWYGALRWLEARRRPDDLILAYPNEGALPLDRALRDRGLGWRVKPIPQAVPAFVPGTHPTGSRGVVSLSQADLEKVARSADIGRARRVWLLRLGAATYDPGDGFLTALRRHRRIGERYIDGPIDIIALDRR